MRRYLHSCEVIVEVVSLANGERLLPRSAVRIERIRKMLMSLVGLRIRRGRRTEKRKAQQVPFRVVPILRFIDQAEAILLVAQVSPAQRRHLELGRLDTVVAGSRPLDGAIRNLERCLWADPQREEIQLSAACAARASQYP